MNTNIGLTEESRQAVADALQVLLADEYVLYTKTRLYHWNVEGPQFMEMHKFYQGQYEALDEIIDDIAERIRSIGHYSTGRLVDFLKLTHLTEQESTNMADQQIVILLNDHEVVVQYLRRCAMDFAETHKDLGTNDFVIGLMEQHEKMCWMLRSFLR